MTAEKTETHRPIEEIRLGGVKAAIWKNQSEKAGTWFSVTLSRTYKQGDSWKQSDSFGPSELPLVINVAERAAGWIEERLRSQQGSYVD
jgi:hypothetical protein